MKRCFARMRFKTANQKETKWMWHFVFILFILRVSTFPKIFNWKIMHERLVYITIPSPLNCSSLLTLHLCICKMFAAITVETFFFIFIFVLVIDSSMNNSASCLEHLTCSFLGNRVLELNHPKTKVGSKSGPSNIMKASPSHAIQAV